MHATADGLATAMNALLIAARTVHFASAILLFGELVFALFIARPGWRADGTGSLGEDRRVGRDVTRIALWSAALSLASGAAWLAAEAASMSGLPLAQAISVDTLGLVLGKTVFGRLWILRFALLIGVAVLLLGGGRSMKKEPAPFLPFGALVLAAVYLASLAWAGHAGAGQGSDRWVQLVSDVVHLLAAGAWLGALPGLVRLLGGVAAFDAAVQATRRFSTVGMASVGALILTGVINALFLVGSVPALVGTRYGQLLLAKLALVVLMVSLAAVNRLRLTPRLQALDAEARRLLRRNAIVETAAGLGVVVIVGTLGVTIPGAHQSPLWPFDRTLSWEAAEDSAAVRAGLVAVGALACLAALCGFWGVRSRRRRVWTAAIIGIITAMVAGTWLLAVPAYPTTYVSSPVRYTTAAIARGSGLYAENCMLCHGRNGYGDGPVAASLPIEPANLVEHAAHHPAGDLFWWIGNGIPGTPMPAFVPRLTDPEIWNLIQFVRALSEAEEARSMSGQVEPWHPIVAPDFTFESPGHPQESLSGERGRHFTLLVLYTLPPSLPRLKALLANEGRLTRAGIRVIALSLRTSSTEAAPADSQTMNDDKSMLAVASADVAAAYTLFARTNPRLHDAEPTHAEFLIDRQGYLRARWLGIPNAATDQTSEVLHQVELLEREPVRPPAPEGHVH